MTARWVRRQGVGVPAIAVARHTLTRYLAGIFSSLHACPRHLDVMLAENEGYALSPTTSAVETDGET